MLQVAVAFCTALPATAVVVVASPGTFFTLHTAAGEPVRSIAWPSFLQITGLVLVFALSFTLAFALLRRTRRLPLAAAFLIIFAVQGGAYAAYGLWQYHETPEFCVRTCHVMEPIYVTYADPGNNVLMFNHTKEEKAKCLDCHSGPGLRGQIDLMLTSARHIWKYTVAGGYDPKNLGGPDAVLTVPDANCEKCHSAESPNPLSAKHGTFTSQCALCHDPHKTDSSGYFYPGAILAKDDCSLCHRRVPTDFVLHPSKHGDLAAKDCRTCHPTHGPPTPTLSCTDAKCHDQDPRNNVSLVALKHAPFATTKDCEGCHGPAHNLTRPSAEKLAAACKTCHAERRLVAGEIHAAPKNATALVCTDCHGTDGPLHRTSASPLSAHGQLRCLNCHSSANHAPGAPVPNFQPVVQSEVAWQRANGANFANWVVKGRGAHDPKADCSQCHRPHNATYRVYPAGKACMSAGCHTWLGNISQTGYPSVYGPTFYRGTLDPVTLLNWTFDVNGNGRDHKVIYQTFGCTGFCHNPNMKIEYAQAWASTGTKPVGLPNGTAHGNVTKCTNCHLFGSITGGPNDLHSTHAPLIQAEEKAADTRGAGREACAYCHSSGPYPENESGGCYNCHLSGHRPVPYYWKGTPPGT